MSDGRVVTTDCFKKFVWTPCCELALRGLSDPRRKILLKIQFERSICTSLIGSISIDITKNILILSTVLAGCTIASLILTPKNPNSIFIYLFFDPKTCSSPTTTSRLDPTITQGPKYECVWMLIYIVFSHISAYQWLKKYNNAWVSLIKWQGLIQKEKIFRLLGWSLQ